MIKITEDHVSFETAKLLKEKGFDAEGVSEFGGYYVDYEHNEQNVGIATESMMLNKNLEDWEYLRPTLQMAMKWLRKVHNLHCVADYDFVLGWYCQITSLKETVEYDYEEMKHYHPEKDNGFSSPEEACEEAIKYCLENLIVSNTNSGTATAKAEG